MLTTMMLLPSAVTEAQTLTITRGGSRPVRQAPAESFTGAARVEMLFETRNPPCDLRRLAGRGLGTRRLVAKGRGGAKSPKPIRAFTKAWKNACRAAGCPGRIPH